MSEYDKQLQAWLARQGAQTVAAAQGKPREATAEFVEPDSEMDAVLTVYVEGDIAEMRDGYGFNLALMRPSRPKHAKDNQ
jgi:hypothetical protein